MSEKQARKKGEALLKRMKGKGWVLRVWENLGWHYSVHLLNLSLHPTGQKYHTLLTNNSAPPYSGETYWSHGDSFSNPNKAVEQQLRISQDFTDTCQKTITDIAKKLKKN